MLIAGIVVGWIVVAAAMTARAMRRAEETPLVECFDCNQPTCEGCPYLEKAKAASGSSKAPVEERRLAA